MLPLLDTDILIDLERGLPGAGVGLISLPTGPPVAGFAAMELYNGCQNTGEQRKVEKFLRPFPLLWPSETSLLRASETFTSPRLAHGVGMLDALIVATALQHRLTLATFNVRHFRAIPGLTTAQPYKR